MKKTFKRVIPIASLFRDVNKWIKENNDNGFIILDSEVCKKIEKYDSNWKGEDAWADALGQYVYAEYAMINTNSKELEVVSFALIEKTTIQNVKDINVSIRSCEDDFCLEILASDIMVRFCIEDVYSITAWEKLVKETGILLRLYQLNKKGDSSFWNDLLKLNQHLGVISEKIVVKFLKLDLIQPFKKSFKELKSFEYESTIPIPKEINDRIALIEDGKRNNYYVTDKQFCYDHPFDNLSEIDIYLVEDYSFNL